MSHTGQATEDTDEELVKKIQDGDKELFAHIVSRYEKRLMAYGKKLVFNPADLEDTVQEIFIKVFQNLLSFDPTRKFSPWIYRIAHNEFINKGKKFSRQLVDYFDFDTLFPHPTTSTTPFSELERKELRERMDVSIEKLEEKYREPLYLFTIENMDYKEIADVLHLPVSTVGVRIMRAKKLLADQLKPHL
jgi:RNA polymerase sigma-70 factor (ECF subfamily)